MLLLLCVKYERKFNNNKSMTNIIKRRPLKKKKKVCMKHILRIKFSFNINNIYVLF